MNRQRTEPAVELNALLPANWQSIDSSASRLVGLRLFASQKSSRVFSTCSAQKRIMTSKHHIAALFYLSVALPSLSPALAACEFQIVSNSVVVLPDVDTARKALRIEDDFIRALSDFDRAARMKSEQPVSREEFLKFIEDEALAWSDQDIARIETAVTGAREKLSKFKLMLPERVLLVQTSGREEAYSAYCRSTNIIAIARHFVSGPSRELESLLIHESFHLLSRNNADLRTKLYALIGFKPCEEIQFPLELDSGRITNPDAPRLDYLIEVTHQEKRLAVVPVMFATPERWTKEKGGEFFAYFTWKLMAGRTGE